MASTNKTTHYELSQYTANDKPTYLVDYNTDMSNIDTGIYNAQSKANSNETAIGNISNLETTAKTDLVSAINELKGKTDGIGNLSNLTTEAQSNLVSAINEVDSHADANNQNIGTMVNLETTVKTSLVGAINEVNANTNTLSGNLSTLQTEIDNTNNYSQTERIVGKYFNNENVYEKDLLITNIDNTQVNQIMSLAGIDKVIDCFGMLFRTNGNDLTIPYYSPVSGQYVDTRLDKVTYNQLVLETNVTSIDSATIRVRYTKSNI